MKIKQKCSYQVLLLPTIQLKLSQDSCNLHDHAKNLGIIFDPLLQFDKHVNAVAKSSFFQLRLVAKDKPFLSKKRSRNCNPCFNFLRIKLLQLLVHRSTSVSTLSATRLITKERDHISPILASLHWLPIKFRVDFKILVFTYKALHNSAPINVSKLIRSYSLQTIKVP